MLLFLPLQFKKVLKSRVRSYQSLFYDSQVCFKIRVTFQTIKEVDYKQEMFDPYSLYLDEFSGVTLDFPFSMLCLEF